MCYALNYSYDIIQTLQCLAYSNYMTSHKLIKFCCRLITIKMKYCRNRLCFCLINFPYIQLSYARQCIIWRSSKFSFNKYTDLITQLHYTDLIYLKRKVFIPRPYLGKQMRYKLQNKTSIRREKSFLIRVFNHKIRKITQQSDLPT